MQPTELVILSMVTIVTLIGQSEVRYVLEMSNLLLIVLCLGLWRTKRNRMKLECGEGKCKIEPG